MNELFYLKKKCFVLKIDLRVFGESTNFEICNVMIDSAAQ